MGAIEGVDRGHGLGGVIPIPAQQLPDVGPIFLLDVGIVVLLVGAPARKLDVMELAVAKEMVVDELGAVVGVEPAQWERHDRHDRGERVADAGLAFAHDRARFDPAGVDVGEVERIGEFAIGRVAGVGNQIDLGKAGDGDRPVIRLDRDVMLEKGPGLGAAIQPTLELTFLRGEMAVNGPRADDSQLALDARRELKPALGPGKPHRQQGLEPQGPGVARRFPDGSQHGIG